VSLREPKAESSLPAVPAEKTYLALVTTEQRKAAQDMSPEGIVALNSSLLAAPRPAAGADLGLVLLSINDVSAAVYATAIQRDARPGGRAHGEQLRRRAESRARVPQRLRRPALRGCAAA